MNKENITDHHHHQMGQNQIHHSNQISFGMMTMQSSSPTPPFHISKDGGAYDLGELDQALFLYLDGQDQSIQDQRQNHSVVRPHTLNIFPSQPMHVEPSKANTGGLVSPETKKSSEPAAMEPSNPKKDVASPSEPPKVVKREGNRKGPTSGSTPDHKTLRRLAQNREAARKSRLRKKAYVQQLESSRMRLTQLEQELQRARSQGFFVGGAALFQGEQGLPMGMGNINSETGLFDMEYGRWLEEHHRMTVELRNAVEDNLPENELRIYVENCLVHYDQVVNLKHMMAKSDVFHLLSGTWQTPAERCFMWIGGFRPSHLIKIMLRQIEGLTEEQVVGICALQESTQEAEEALSQGLDALHQSLSQTIISDSLIIPPEMNTYMAHMALAINKLSTLEAFLKQADNLRHQSLHRMHEILMTLQAAHCFLAMAEYFHRLRGLSSLWLARPRHD